MPQAARPVADASIGAWTDQGGGAVNLFSRIDEVFADESDHIRSEPLFPGATSTAYATKLASVTDPGFHTDHRVRYFIKKVDPGTILLLVQLRHGYVSEGQQGTLIAERLEQNLSALSFESSIALTEAEAGTITDYSDLHLRFVASRDAVD